MSTITPEQSAAYVASGGDSCPICRDNQIEGGHILIDAAYAYQDCSCNACEATWTDRYQLVAAESMED